MISTRSPMANPLLIQGTEEATIATATIKDVITLAIVDKEVLGTIIATMISLANTVAVARNVLGLGLGIVPGPGADLGAGAGAGAGAKAGAHLVVGIATGPHLWSNPNFAEPSILSSKDQTMIRTMFPAVGIATGIPMLNVSKWIPLIYISIIL
jgi:hypothetical protein